MYCLYGAWRCTPKKEAHIWASVAINTQTMWVVHIKSPDKPMRVKGHVKLSSRGLLMGCVELSLRGSSLNIKPYTTPILVAEKKRDAAY